MRCPETECGGAASGPRRLGLRAEKRTSGGCLTVASSARLSEGRIRINRRMGLSIRLVANLRLRRSERLRSVFRTDAARCPHCAGGLMRLRRGRRPPLAAVDWRSPRTRSRPSHPNGAAASLTRSGPKNSDAGSPATDGVGHHVMKLQEAALPTPSGCTDKCAAPFVAGPDLAA